MRLRDVVRIARMAVPGGGTPRVKLLSAGLLHNTYRIDRNGHAFSMRLAGAPARGAPRATRDVSLRDGAWVLKVLQLAADRSLAPPLVCSNAPCGITVQEWVEGRAWSAASAGAERNIERFAALLRLVHALPVPRPARISTPGLWVGKYTAALAAQRRTAKHGAERAAMRAPERAASVKRAAVPSLAAAAANLLARFEALPRVAAVVCHSDLHRLNVLDYRPRQAKARALLLLDWEYAHVSEPFWDLAGWSANNDFADHRLWRLLAAYLGREPAAAEWTRCKLLCWLYDYVCLLWSDLYLRSHRGREASEVELRAAVLLDRLSLDIGDLANFRHTTV